MNQAWLDNLYQNIYSFIEVFKVLIHKTKLENTNVDFNRKGRIKKQYFQIQLLYDSFNFSTQETKPLSYSGSLYWPCIATSYEVLII